MLKVLIITQNEPFYIPKMVRYLLENEDNDFKIAGFTVLSPARKNAGFLGWLKERASIYTIYELFLVGFTFIFVKAINSILQSNTPYSISKIFKKAKVPCFVTEDINSGEYMESIAALNLDVIISISCPQLFGSNILVLPKHYCLNAHGTLLPKHRGVFGGFWTLYDKDPVAGSTIHTMELKLDAGEIVWQKEFSISPSDSQYSIAYKTKRDMAEGLVEVLKRLNREGKLIPIKPRYKVSYHRAPNKKNAIEFRNKGKRIIVFKNLNLILKKSF